MNDIKVGSVVFLNSNPDVLMTVTGMAPGEIRVVYFDYNTREFKSIRFPPAAVTLAQ